MHQRYTTYVRKVLWHKVCVFREGRALGVPLWNLAWHDWDKFLPAMIVAYARYFYNADGSQRRRSGYVRYGATADDAFNRAWLAHMRRNRHHWDYHVAVHGELVDPLPMPFDDALEMLADWRGAARSYGGDARQWYLEHRTELVLHPATRKWVETMLELTDDERLVRSSVWDAMYT